ncbi:MAG: lytic transglycosylase domain-containing protein [Deltaproteobacteria bacterium]|nr:lytic transglycosylase domain-containing protein [Deltaproteobacteria bacterium]
MPQHRLMLLTTLLIASCASQPQRRATRPATGKNTSYIKELATSAAARHGVDPNLVLGVIYVESRFDPQARSHVGARGLMQLMPRTAASLAKQLGYDDYRITDPRFNIDAGTYYLGYLLRRFKRIDVALAAYNAGPSRIARRLRDGKPLADYSLSYANAVRNAWGADAPVLRDRYDREGLRQLLRREIYGRRANEAVQFDNIVQLIRKKTEPRKIAEPQNSGATATSNKASDESS